MKKILSVVAAIVILAGGGVVAYWAYTHPAVHIVNASSAPSLSVFVDDGQVATGLEPAVAEETASTKSASVHVPAGDHTITAKDASGNVIDTQKVTIEAGGVYLYAPAHSRTVCWTLQTDAYGSAHVEKPMQLLDAAHSFWKLPESPDYWFQDTPNTVKVKGKKSTKKSALRQHSCDDSAFGAQ